MNRFIFLILTALFVTASCAAKPATAETDIWSPPMGYGHDIGGQHLGTTKGDYSAFGKSLPSDMVTGNPTPQNGVQTQFPIASVYTVQFRVEQPPPPAGLGPFEYQCEAIVNWTIAGNTVQRRVSVINGMSISGVGTGVNVQLIDQTTNYPTGTKYKIVTSVAPGPRSSYPTFPVLAGLRNSVLVAGGFLAVPVPADAGVVAVRVLIGEFLVAQFPPRVNVRFDNANGVSSFAQYDPNVFNDWIPIFPGTQRITILNIDPARDCLASVIFGIDG